MRCPRCGSRLAPGYGRTPVCLACGVPLAVAGDRIVLAEGEQVAPPAHGRQVFSAATDAKILELTPAGRRVAWTEWIAIGAAVGCGPDSVRRRYRELRRASSGG